MEHLEDAFLFTKARRYEVKETRQHEIDFVVNRGNGRVYIQSALDLHSEAKREQESLSLKRSGDFFRKVIVTGGKRSLWLMMTGLSMSG